MRPRRDLQRLLRRAALSLQLRPAHLVTPRRPATPHPLQTTRLLWPEGGGGWRPGGALKGGGVHKGGGTRGGGGPKGAGGKTNRAKANIRFYKI